MMKRTLLTFVAATAVSASAVIAPALVTPAAAQANLNISLGVPGPEPMVVAPQPTYVAWGERRWEERRAWERRHYREERHHEFYEHHYR